MSGLAPWHLWGNSQSLTFTQVASVNNPPTTQQLVKIAYRRPETWTFLFYLQITNATAGASPGIILNANFDVILGVGRSQLSIPTFIELVAAVPGGGGPSAVSWTTMAYAPGLLKPDDGSSASVLISEIPAQDIQVQVRSGMPLGAQQPVTIEVGAFFSPKVHVRPDWLGRPEFSGEERGGH